MYISPKRLKQGSRVAIIAPSSPFKADELSQGIDIIREAGLEPVLGPNVQNLRTIGIHSADVLQRADELMWAFSDPTISGIIVATGGMGAGQVLPYLKYDVIAASRKPLIGMSDITALQTGILTASGLISFNAQSPNIRLDKGRKAFESDVQSMKLTLEMIMSDRPWEDRPFDINPYVPRTISHGTASGYVVGGNCDTFVHLLGTPYFPECEGAILFIEDVHKNGEVLARQFIHLQLAGVLDRVSGVVIGEFVDVPKKIDERTPSIEDTLQEFFAGGVPCSYGYSFSHGDMTSPIPIGALCNLDADTGSVSFDYTMGR